MRMYGRRRQISPEETAANAKARAERESASMTCQCCGRRFLANTGLMAHHGYQRPGGGWQTASCYGARHLPFEVSRDTLGDMIMALETHRDRLLVTRQEMVDEKHPLTVSYEDYSQPKAWSILRNRHAHPEVTVEFTRETFAVQMEVHKIGLTRYGRSVGSFDDRKAADIAGRDGQIKRVRADIHDSQRRFDGWSQTHEWDSAAKIWVKR
jgi:hypothetical protein